MTESEHAGAGTTDREDGPDPLVGDRSVALVTGATSGIGRAAARRLAGRGAHVVIVGRDRERARAAAAECAAAGGTASALRADLASPDAVRALARTVRERRDRLDVLVHCAAVSSRHRRTVPYAGGVERTFAVNHLAPYLLTHELVGYLRASAPARIVTVASAVHRRAEGDLDADLAAVTGGEEDYDALASYARSKRANVLFALELAARLDGTGVASTAVHPGFVPGSRLFRDARPGVRLVTGLLARLPVPVGDDAATAGDRVAAVASAPPGVDTDGAYVEEGVPTEPAPAASDPTARATLWRASARLTGVDPAWP